MNNYSQVHCSDYQKDVMAKLLEEGQMKLEHMTKFVYASAFVFVCANIFFIWTVASR